ncbi:MAG: DUF262 domain-containing protein [Chloroflexi bacterium]|nr:DUF262 domain-containing protein [Chloroflexota bacterium]
MSKVQAQTKSVRELLSGVRYDIDFYQREYVWERRQVEELLNDLEHRFQVNYDAAHERSRVASYPHYFLGTIITKADAGTKSIVDGQQRLTTLTLLLIHIHNLREENPSVFDVSPLIFSMQFGKKDFNIAVPERVDCMRSLFDTGAYAVDEHSGASVSKLVARYDELDELFPESLQGDVLPYFVDWLIENVDLVEIEAQSDDDAFTIFETMNDRGVNLSQTDMLKGYLLANIGDDNALPQRKRVAIANKEWQRLTSDLKQLWHKEDEVVIKHWLRAKYAQTIRERKKGAANRDFEQVDKFHRWVRDNHARLGLQSADAFYDFITRQFGFFARQYMAMHRAAYNFTTGREELYYNRHNNFTLQFMLAMAPLRLEDNVETVARKIRLVTSFADIFLARRMVHRRRSGYSALYYTMFNIAKRIRNTTVEELRDILLDLLYSADERFQGIDSWGDWGSYFLNKASGNNIRYLLARMTAWIERECGNTTTFVNYMWDAKGRPLEIEHIWANKFDNHQDEFSDRSQFERHRNFFGGLVLLPRGTNQSFGDMPYEDKLPHYLKQNLLAASLHPQT